MMSEASAFIDGVYNYCDRWCERCSLKSRCQLYATDENACRELTSHDPDDAAFWDAIENVFAQTVQMLRDLVQREGIDLEAVSVEEDKRRREEVRRRTLGHPLVIAAHLYSQSVSKWFERQKPRFEEIGRELNQQAELRLTDTNPAGEAVALENAVEVIRWYQYQIPVKLARAVSSLTEAGKSLDAVLVADANGSAKVALLAIDCSLASWTCLRAAVPDADDSVLDFLVALDRLRRIVEQAVPGARSFLRPGFDRDADSSDR